MNIDRFVINKLAELLYKIKIGEFYDDYDEDLKLLEDAQKELTNLSCHFEEIESVRCPICRTGNETGTQK